MKITQKDRLRALFTNRPSIEIPLTEIADMRIMQYGRVIGELRREGMDIKNRTQFINGVNCSWFTYTPGAAAYKKQEEFNYAGKG